MAGMANTTDTDARARLFQLTATGLMIAVFGGIVAGVSWPRNEISLLGEVDQVGNYAAFVAGSLIGWAGSMMLFVGLVGYGVMLGREASPSAGT